MMDSLWYCVPRETSMRGRRSAYNTCQLHWDSPGDSTHWSVNGILSVTVPGVWTALSLEHLCQQSSVMSAVRDSYYLNILILDQHGDAGSLIPHQFLFRLKTQYLSASDFVMLHMIQKW